MKKIASKILFTLIIVLLILISIIYINFKKEVFYPVTDLVSLGGFCGSSTYDYCEKDSDCSIGGCSSEICSGTNNHIVSGCVSKDCYDERKYNTNCGCVNNMCRWHK